MELLTFSKEFEHKHKVMHVRPTSDTYKSLCETICAYPHPKDTKWGYVMFMHTMLAIDIPLFILTKGQKIPNFNNKKI